MNRYSLSTIIGMGLIFVPHTASAQSPIGKPTVGGSTVKAEAKTEVDHAARERREQARSLLISLASDARAFRDQTLRARILARIADLLWDADLERGRELFRKAWEAAVSTDQDTARRRQEDIQRQSAKTGGGYAITDYPNLRGELLRLVARHDRVLGEEFLQSLKADQTDVNGKDQRLSLARDLLATGDTEGALHFAGAELSTINVFTVDFLSRLREKDSVAADERYAVMLDTAARNVLSDANTVSLLSSYLFAPNIYITFHGGAMSCSMMGTRPPPADVPPALRSRFFQMAASVLLRTEPPASPELQTAGIEDQYLVIKRLSPWFEQYAPQELTEAIRARFEALGAMVRDSIRRRDPNPNRENPSETESANREQAILDKIEHAATSAERDRLYFELAQQASTKDDLRARDFVSKIEDSEFRNQAAAYIDVTLATHLIQKKKIPPALELSQKGELTHIQRVWLFTQLAKLLAKTDHDKSLALLEDAVSGARRIEGSDPDRPRALMAIANALRLVEPSRTWDSVFEGVKAANSAEAFTGEDGNLNILFHAKGFSTASDLPEPDFDIKGIFALLAREDYDRAVDLARGFQGEAPRATAVIAIARSVLDEKRAPVAAPLP